MENYSRFQTLTIPFYVVENKIEVLLLNRIKPNFWQFVTGGNLEGEIPSQTARREVKEETGLTDGKLYPLETQNSLPSRLFKFYKPNKAPWIVKEFCFGFSTVKDRITLSGEHSKYQWITLKKAFQMLSFDGDKTALWELEQKINGELLF